MVKEVLRMTNFDIFGDSLKNPTFRDVSWKTNIEGGLLKKGIRTVCRLKRGEFGKNEGVVFLRGDWYPNAHYDNLESAS